jgi:hypothetical protein
VVEEEEAEEEAEEVVNKGGVDVKAVGCTRMRTSLCPSGYKESECGVRIGGAEIDVESVCSACVSEASRSCNRLRFLSGLSAAISCQRSSREVPTSERSVSECAAASKLFASRTLSGL